MSASNIYFYKDEKTRKKFKDAISKVPEPSSVVIAIYHETATSILENSQSKNPLCEMHLWEFLLYGEKAREVYLSCSEADQKKFDSIDFHTVCACLESHEALPEELKDTINRLKRKFENIDIPEEPVSLSQDDNFSPSESTPLLSVNYSDKNTLASSESSLFNFFCCCIRRNQEDSNEIPLQVRRYNT